MDIKVVDDQGNEVIPETAKPMESKQIEGAVLPEIEIKAIGSVLGLERESEFGQYKERLHTLIEYAKTQTNDHSPEGLKAIIRNLGSKVGTPPLGEKNVNFLSRYAYLLLEEMRLKKEREGFERAR
jgi:hypothetical protein